MNENIGLEIRLRRRPVGMPSEKDFELAQTVVPHPSEGQILVQNLYMSVDPYMRGRMDDRESYLPPFQVGRPLEGSALGRVVESKSEKFREGDHVLNMLGWREYALSDGKGIAKIELGGAPLTACLSVLGMTGLTAYVGLLEVGRPKEGETVFVSAASGAVGSVACQIARIKGCRVVGTAGSRQKTSWLEEEAGISAAINYREVEDLAAELRTRCPKGIDVYYDNVGGRQLEAALGQMNPFGRIVLCGMISLYNAVDPVPGPRNLFMAIQKRLLLQGFLVGDHMDLQAQFRADMEKWIGEGKIRWKETVLDGIENAPKAFMGLFEGENFGKMLVRLTPGV